MDVFTAVEQKHTFEVRKTNLSQRRVLCRACHRIWVELDREVRECRRRWAAAGAALRDDPAFLRRWLTVMEQLVEYNGSHDEANLVMVRRLIAGE